MAALAVSLAALAVSQLAPAGERLPRPRFRPYVSLYGGWAEPGVIAGNGKTIFVDAPPGRLWRSTDAGRTFTALDFGTAGELFLTLGGGDSDTVVRGDRVYYADLWLGSSTMLRSDDAGDTWRALTPLSSLTLIDRQWIALGERDGDRDTVYSIYALIEPPYQVFFARSDDSGHTWATQTPTPALLAARGYTGPLVSRGRVVAFPWIDGDRLSFAVSFDAGDTWSTTTVSTTASEASFPVAALNGPRVHVAWVDRASHRVRVATSTDRGRTFKRERVVSGSDLAVFPWLAARGGKVAVAWYGAQVRERVAPDDVPASTVWRARYAESLDRGRRFSVPVTVGPGKTGAICTGGLACDSGRELGDYLSVDIMRGGRAVVAFGGQVPGAIKVARQR